MALQTFRIGSLPGFQYDDADYDSAVEATTPIKAGAPVDPEDVVRLSDIPNFAAAADGSFTCVSAIQAGGVGAIGFQYKTRTMTVLDGVITVIGAESGWNDI